ncbi:MAG: hypothetical protein ACLP7O_13090 [Terracidiphilus sp.]
MLTEEQATALRHVQESDDEQLLAWWAGFGVEDIGNKILAGDNWSDWYLLVVSELIYRGFCFQKENGIECADRGVPVSEMCPGCKSYWIQAARLAGKTTMEWIAECTT